MRGHYIFSMVISLILSIPAGAGFAQFSTPTPLPWPMFCKNAANTGYSAHDGPPLPRLWDQYDAHEDIMSSPSIGLYGNVYIGSNDNYVYALDFSSSSELWNYKTGGDVTSSPAVATDTVYIGSDDNILYALDPLLGTLQWSFETGSDLKSSPVFTDNGRIYFGSSDTAFYALESDGTLVWSYMTGDRISSSPAVGDDDVVYFGSEDRNVYALTSDGAILWTFSTDDRVSSSPAVVATNTVYIGSDDFNLYTLDSDGSELLLWSYQTGAMLRSSPAVDSQGNIYIGSLDSALYAFDSDGDLGWTYITAGKIYSSPAVDGNGKIYFGSDDYALYVLESNGSFSWSYETIGKISSSPAIGADDDVYFGSEDNFIYCIKSDPTPTPTSTPTATPEANYVELDVLSKAGGYNFDTGDQVVLEWEVFPDQYGFNKTTDGVRLDVYVGARVNPSVEDGPATVEQVTSTSELYIFDDNLAPSLFDPTNVPPTYKNVGFPLENDVTKGTLIFTVPEGVTGRWVFATAFIRRDNGQFPVPTATPPVEVSNGFDLNP